jgi:hypothetical protein
MGIMYHKFFSTLIFSLKTDSRSEEEKNPGFESILAKFLAVTPVNRIGYFSNLTDRALARRLCDERQAGHARRHIPINNDMPCSP